MSRHNNAFRTLRWGLVLSALLALFIWFASSNGGDWTKLTAALYVIWLVGPSVVSIIKNGKRKKKYGT